MAQRGGYKIIDLKNTPLETGVASTIVGGYEALENNYGKPTLLSGLVIGGTVYSDLWVNFVASGGNYSASLGSIGTITVTANDEVTVTAPAG